MAFRNLRGLKFASIRSFCQLMQPNFHLLSIENEFFLIVPNPADGTLRITDKMTATTFSILCRIV